MLLVDTNVLIDSMAFEPYGRRRRQKGRGLPDFVIGAHAAVSGYPLLTRDRGQYRTCFSDIEIIAPACNPAPD